MAPTEAVAVAFGVAYIVLAIGRRRACWVAGGIGSALYAFVFLDARLPMQAGLQLVYVAISFYGWAAWQRGEAGAGVRPRHWPLARHAWVAGAVALASAVSAALLARLGASEAPVADATGTVASLAATWMLAERVTEAWLWWIVIDAALAGLFASQGLYATGALYLAYAVLAAAGWRGWHRARQAADA